MFSGGEQFLLPDGQIGQFGQPGLRKDGRNFIAEAGDLGYSVVYSRDEMQQISVGTKKILGVFAARHTFNDRSEEDLKALDLPMYEPAAPTLAEMTRSALSFFEHQKRPFFLVIEEEGTDNFGNKNNARGVLTALSRTDDAIGVVMEFIKKNPNTLLVTAADSDAGGMHVHEIPADRLDKELSANAYNGAPVDGRDGTGSLPFIAAPDQFGERLGFAISWATYSDVYGGVVARAHGLNADLLPNNVDNTDIYRLMYATLFGEWLNNHTNSRGN
jgi:alkaline phosphatase